MLPGSPRVDTCEWVWMKTAKIVTDSNEVWPFWMRSRCQRGWFCFDGWPRRAGLKESSSQGPMMVTPNPFQESFSYKSFYSKNKCLVASDVSFLTPQLPQYWTLPQSWTRTWACLKIVDPQIWMVNSGCSGNHYLPTQNTTFWEPHKIIDDIFTWTITFPYVFIFCWKSR